MLAMTALALDLDGVLIDSERTSRAGWRSAMEEFGLTLSDEEYLPMIGLAGRDVEALFRQRYHLAPPFKAIWDRKMEWMNRIIAEEGIPLKPGAMEFLDAADAAGWKKAVATSTDRERARFKLTVSGLAGRCAVVACGDEVPRGKPAPDVFLLAAKRLGVPPEQCLALEDSDPGVIAASEAGMRVIIVPDMKPPSPEAARLAWKIVPTLLDALEYLDVRTK
jgi:HAD superfamily hydrolase (TIGR01509 family)